MNDKFQREKSNDIERMKDERLELLLFYTFVGGKCWQEKSSDALNKTVMKHIKKALIFFNLVLH